MSWKPEVLIDGRWLHNGLWFATQEEAEMSARNLLVRWQASSNARATECTGAINARYEDGHIVRVVSNGHEEQRDRAQT